MLIDRGVALQDPQTPPMIDRVEVAPSRPIPRAVVEAAGTTLTSDPEARIRHSGGQSLGDLLTRRSGVVRSAPDAVATPEDEDRLRAIVEAAGSEGVALVPWGGGTSVTGGLTIDGSRFDAVLAVDMARFTAFNLDPVSMTVRLGAGLRGPEAEGLLNSKGFTLGHFPQSFEFATIGGFAAARSAGQASSGYGRFDDLVSSLRLVTPMGTVTTPVGPRSSAGPSIRQMALGSEGALGFITEVTVRIRPIPEASRYEGWLVRDFAEGSDAVRRLAQTGRLPTVIRVSDLEESAVSIGMSRPDGIPGRLFDLWLKARGRSSGALVITGYEGGREEIRSLRAATAQALSGAGAIRLGKRAGEGWRKGRFHGPYLREALLDSGLVVETFETSAVWSEYLAAYEAIRGRTVERLEKEGMKGIVMCHLSHAYRESASLYFTVIASPGPKGPVESWRSVKAAAMDVISAAGLTVSHHHGVGRDHVEWLESEVGDSGLAALNSLKAALDPAGIMNPDCLIRRRDSDLHRPR